jgi:hypothetical protein
MRYPQRSHHRFDGHSGNNVRLPLAGACALPRFSLADAVYQKRVTAGTVGFAKVAHFCIIAIFSRCVRLIHGPLVRPTLNIFLPDMRGVAAHYTGCTPVGDSPPAPPDRSPATLYEAAEADAPQIDSWAWLCTSGEIGSPGSFIMQASTVVGWHRKGLRRRILHRNITEHPTRGHTRTWHWTMTRRCQDQLRNRRPHLWNLATAGGPSIVTSVTPPSQTFRNFRPRSACLPTSSFFLRFLANVSSPVSNADVLRS